MVQFLDELPSSERQSLLKGNNQRDWEAIARDLRLRPWKWAIIAEDVWPSSVTRMRQGRYRAFTPPRDYHFTTRGRKTGKVLVLARFVGAPKPDDVDDNPSGFRERRSGWRSR